MFEFYEKVIVRECRNGDRTLEGELGAVLGRVETDDGAWYYTVYIYKTCRCACFFEDELESTGEHGKREDFFSGETIRVQVDSEGRGRIVEEKGLNGD